MTAPDEGLEEVLRRALSAAAEQVEPGDHGLDRIQARTRATPIPSLPVSLAMAAVRRVRHWTWRGHWAWQDPAYWRDSATVRRAASLLEDLTRLIILTCLRGLTGLICLRDLSGLTGIMIFTGIRDLTSLRDLTGSNELSRIKKLLTSLKGLVHWLSRRPSLRLAFQTRGLVVLSATAGLTMLVSVTAAAMAVPPLRSVLVQVSSSVLTGGNDVIQPGITSTGPGGGSPAGVGGNRISSRSGSAGTGPRGAAPGRPGTSPSEVPCAVSPSPTASGSPTRSLATGVAVGAQATSVPGTPTVVPSPIAYTSASASATCATPAPTSSLTASPAPTPVATPSTTPTQSPTTPATSTAPATSSSPATPPDTGSPSATPTVTSSAPPTSGNSSTGTGNCCDQQSIGTRVLPGPASDAISG